MPLGNKYKLDDIVYQANIAANNDNDNNNDNNNEKVYVSMSSLNWKFRY